MFIREITFSLNTYVISLESDMGCLEVKVQSVGVTRYFRVNRESPETLHKLDVDIATWLEATFNLRFTPLEKSQLSSLIGRITTINEE